ncbi:SIS domain-containing protein [Pelagovum pacificum]|uniref:SIS domain-containing protein n=1 Tax=Pelagovum pacificum TaxID=2588711 RepID=A0A5C5GET6_9RHOB|nr:SIS domain-containing protein [Pelagovum pacificum]QQA44151.1 SIS domain-containing protein [Pelagovum pacificum]TNY32724.1 SIS domain-containing protein [Pelagovum pacificum]
MSDALTQWTTWREIGAQPDIWRRWEQDFALQDVRAWIAGLDVDEVWFCGAGSSAFIGDIVASGIKGERPFRSVPTTDLISRPDFYLSDRRPLVVSFGRSGGSPETLGSFDALDVLTPDAPRLNVTCNPDGALAKRKATGECGVVVLPPQALDQGFAMTSSFTTMLLTALALFDAESRQRPFTQLADALDILLPEFTALASDTDRPSRIVFLGTGAMSHAARESALKVLELTAGRTAAIWDSPLGFRHGPMSFVDDETRIVLFTSREPQAARYEADLLDELSRQFPGQGLTTVGANADFDPNVDLPDAWLTPIAVALAQVLGVTWSDRLGLDVDDPFAGKGTLSRVVSGVTLYPVRRS